MTDDSGTATVLIVEDEEPLADLYALSLDDTYTVHTASNGTEALDRMHSDVDVVLLDRRMPGLSGEEVLEAIRNEGYDCRVAMVTAVTPDVDIVEMEVDEYHTKPVDRTALAETVGRLVELGAYEYRLQEYYQLVSKQAALEGEKSTVDIADSVVVDQLTDRLHDLETELNVEQEFASEADFSRLLNRVTTSSEDV